LLHGTFCMLPAPPAPSLSALSLHDALPIFDADKSGTLTLRVRAFDAASPGLPPAGAARAPRTRARRALAASTASSPSRERRRRRSEEHTSELQSRENLVCRLLLEKKNAYTG